MSFERDDFKQGAEKQLGKKFKRQAPAPRKPKEVITDENEKWGKPTAFRFRQSTRDKLDAVASQYNVRKSDLAEFFILAGIDLLQRGTIKLPVRDEQSNRLRLPEG